MDAGWCYFGALQHTHPLHNVCEHGAILYSEGFLSLVLGFKDHLRIFFSTVSQVSLINGWCKYVQHNYYFLQNPQFILSHTHRVKVHNGAKLIKNKLKKRVDVKHSICSQGGLKLTWMTLLPQGEQTLKCSLTMKWPCPVMVVNGCTVQIRWV